MSKWIRQTHRLLSVAFTLTVIANFVAMTARVKQAAALPGWVP